MLNLPVDVLKRFIETAFVKSGVPAEDAKICSEILITSDLRGIGSHGIGRLRMYVDRLNNGQIEKTTS